MSVTIIGSDPAITKAIRDHVQGLPHAALIYVAPQREPDLREALQVFESNDRDVFTVVVSSARVYGASPQNPGLITESRPCCDGPWLELERLAQSLRRQVAVLRVCTVLSNVAQDEVNACLHGRFAFTLPGHDPSLQLMTGADLGAAVMAVISARKTGIYNIAPAAVIPLRAALRHAGVSRIALPRTLRRLVTPASKLEFIRYSWTICNRKMTDELGFTVRRSSREALADLTGRANELDSEHDPFGFDPSYVDSFGRTLFRFLYRHYWRVEEKGFERIPKSGCGVLVGIHRGFMPWDGVMALHSVVQHCGRYPRFLVHPSLLKFPFLFNFMRKLGGILACQENADRILQKGGLVGVFPEGIRGAFTVYRDAHRLGRFVNDEFVRMALRNSAPIIPFVTIGSAEIFPIWKTIRWKWWERYTDWPSFPITPTFPLLPPIPLPSKWHIQWLQPIPAGLEHPPAAASDAELVRSISRGVRSAMVDAMQQILRRRKNLFFGSVFQEESS